MGATLFRADTRTDGQMDRRNEINSRFSQFRDCSKQDRNICALSSIRTCYFSNHAAADLCPKHHSSLDLQGTL
jgi:hypothetical protein